MNNDVDNLLKVLREVADVPVEDGLDMGTDHATAEVIRDASTGTPGRGVRSRPLSLQRG